MSQLFAWSGQSTGVSALASFLPKKSQGWSPSEWIGWISLQSKGLSRVFSNPTVQKHQFFSELRELVMDKEAWRAAIRGVEKNRTQLSDWSDLIWSWLWGFPSSSDGKESACNAGDLGLIPRSGRSPGEGNGNPLQYSCLENSDEATNRWPLLVKNRTQNEMLGILVPLQGGTGCHWPALLCTLGWPLTLFCTSSSTYTRPQNFRFSVPMKTKKSKKA